MLVLWRVFFTVIVFDFQGVAVVVTTSGIGWWVFSIDSQEQKLEQRLVRHSA